MHGHLPRDRKVRAAHTQPDGASMEARSQRSWRGRDEGGRHPADGQQHRREKRCSLHLRQTRNVDTNCRIFLFSFSKHLISDFTTDDTFKEDCSSKKKLHRSPAVPEAWRDLQCGRGATNMQQKNPDIELFTVQNVKKSKLVLFIVYGGARLSAVLDH